MVSLIDESGLANALGAKALAWVPLAPRQASPELRGADRRGERGGSGDHPSGCADVIRQLAARKAAGLPLMSLLMTMVALQLANLRLAAAKGPVCFWEALTLLVLVPVDCLWWRYLNCLGCRAVLSRLLQQTNGRMKLE